jgi:hypothetical protein
VLTELQRQIARILLSALPDSELALAGGAALIARGLVQRDTIDLDLFTTLPDVERLVAPMEAALEGAGLDVERLLVTPSFVRVLVSGGGENCQVALGASICSLRGWPAWRVRTSDG